MIQWYELNVAGEEEVIKEVAADYGTSALVNGKCHLEGKSEWTHVLELIHLTPDSMHILAAEKVVREVVKLLEEKGCKILSRKKVREATFSFAIEVLNEEAAGKLDEKIHHYIADPEVKIVDYDPEVLRNANHQGLRTYVHPFEMKDQHVLAVSSVSRLISVYEEFMKEPLITIHDQIHLIYEPDL